MVEVALDTDAFGTFTGDVPRHGTPGEVVRAKARAAAAAGATPLGLASEGTFRPHPHAPLTIDTELVAVVDVGTGWTVTGVASAPAAWAVSVRLGPLDDVADRLGRLVPWPPVAVVRDESGAAPPLKDLTGGAEVAGAVRAMRAAGVTTVVVETDLRADRCPPRGPVIAAAAEDLARRLATTCDHCGLAGVGVERHLPGLPCDWCGGPTSEPRGHVEACPSCGSRREVLSGGTADPARCPRCNP